jgi:tetratricopeptide (TPR) repeat protein
MNRITWEENTDLHIMTIEESEQLMRRYQRCEGPEYLIVLRNLSVSYDQLARLCSMLEDQTNPALRESCGRKLQAQLKLSETEAGKPGFFLLAAEACFQQGLKLSKICQQHDTFSDSRIYDLHYSFYALGKLYFRKEFPGYNPDRALQYFEDGLSSIMDIALRPESHERYIRVPVKIYEQLTDLHMEAGAYTAAKKYLAEGARMRDLRVLYHPSADADFDRCYCYEQEADIVAAEQGIDAAESYYLTAARHYRECGKKYSDLFVQRAPHIVYYKVAKAYKENSNLGKYVEYTRMELAEIQRLYGLYPSASLRWDWGVTQELLANALRKIDFEGTSAQRRELQESAIAIYHELAAEYPQVDKYQRAPSVVYYCLLLDYCEAGMYEDALRCLDMAFSLCRRMVTSIPDCGNLLDLPIRMFLHIYEHIADQAVYQKYFDECKDYIACVTSHCQEQDFEEMRLRFLLHEAKRIWDTQGIAAAEQCYLDHVEQAKEYAAKYPSPGSCIGVTSGYTALYQGYLAVNQRDKAIFFLQEALGLLDRGIEQWPDSVSMRRLRAILYGCLADLFKDSTDVQLVSASVDLYILQLQSYMGLYQDAEDQSDKDAFGKKITQSYSALIGYLRIHEGMIKACRNYPSYSKEMLRSYVKIMVNAYSFLVECRAAGAQEKLDDYTALLNQLGDV